MDAGVSITIGDQHIANWLIGQVRTTESDETEVLNYASSINIEPLEFLEAFREVPVISSKKFNKIAEMLFEFVNAPTSLRLKLTIGPGPTDIRQKLLNLAFENDPPFHSTHKSLNQNWNTIFVRSLFSLTDYQMKDIDELTTELHDKWDRILTNDIPQILQVVGDQEWIWMGKDTSD